MKKLLLIGLALSLSACSDDVFVVNDVQPKSVEGLYQFKEVSSDAISGTLELKVNYEGKIDLIETQSFITKNTTDSYGTFPRLSRSGLTSSSEIVAQYAVNLNYNSGTDIEKDGSTSNISGSKYTRVMLTIDTDDKLLLTVMVHDGSTSSSGGINEVVVTRTFKSLQSVK